jgi:hypothetical protein
MRWDDAVWVVEPVDVAVLLPVPSRWRRYDHEDFTCHRQAHEPPMSLLSDSVTGTRQDWHEIDNRPDRRGPGGSADITS